MLLAANTCPVTFAQLPKFEMQAMPRPLYCVCCADSTLAIVVSLEAAFGKHKQPLSRRRRRQSLTLPGDRGAVQIEIKFEVLLPLFL